MYIDDNNKKKILEKISACCKEKDHGTILLYNPTSKNPLIVPSSGWKQYSSLEEQNWFREETKKIANHLFCYYSRTKIKIDFIPVLSDPLKNGDQIILYNIPRIVILPG